MANQISPQPDPKTYQAWSPLKRGLISLWLSLHLLAIVAAPLAGPPPSSELSRGLASQLEWYIRPMFLGHGYRFFAPNPGPSHLVRYELVMANGDSSEGMFPDLDEQWPRLLYHRMFMMSETVNSVTNVLNKEDFQERMEAGREEVRALREAGHRVQADRIERDLDLQRAEYQRAVETRDVLLEAIAQRLAIEHGAKEVRLYSVEHLIPTPLDVELGMDLNDPDLWLERPIFEWKEPQQ